MKNRPSSQRVIERLRQGHHQMGRVLTLLRLQVDQFGGSTDLQGLNLMENAINYMRGYPGLAHHPTEELIFSKMISERPSAQGLCVGLQDQHQWFRDQEIALLRLIREAQAGDAGACEALRQQLRSYCTRHADHISIEEARVFTLAEELLTESDWGAVLASLEIHVDPLSDMGLQQRYESLYDYLMKEDGSIYH